MHKKIGSLTSHPCKFFNRWIDEIHDSDVSCDLALIHPNPYRVLSRPNLPSIGSRSPGSGFIGAIFGGLTTLLTKNLNDLFRLNHCHPFSYFNK
jgi:hypothetical protein